MWKTSFVKLQYGKSVGVEGEVLYSVINTDVLRETPSINLHL